MNYQTNKSGFKYHPKTAQFVKHIYVYMFNPHPQQTELHRKEIILVDIVKTMHKTSIQNISFLFNQAVFFMINRSLNLSKSVFGRAFVKASTGLSFELMARISIQFSLHIYRTKRYFSSSYFVLFLCISFFKIATVLSVSVQIGT